MQMIRRRRRSVASEPSSRHMRAVLCPLHSLHDALHDEAAEPATRPLPPQDHCRHETIARHKTMADLPYVPRSPPPKLAVQASWARHSRMALSHSAPNRYAFPSCGESVTQGQPYLGGNCSRTPTAPSTPRQFHARLARGGMLHLP